MGKFYWLKLKKDFYKRHDIVILESMEHGVEIELIYIKMLCESIDHDGDLRFNDNIAYNAKMLSSIFNTTEEIIKKALEVLEDLELLEIKDDGTIHMTKLPNFVGCETESAEKKRIQRNLPTLKNGSKRVNGNCIITPDGKKHSIDEKRYAGHGMQAMDRAFGKCEICGSSEGVVIHHNNGYSSELDDLVCLCSSCHGKAHSKTNGGHVEIERPPYVHHMSTDCPPNVHQMSAQSKSKNKSKEIDKEIDNRDRNNTFSSSSDRRSDEDWKPQKEEFFLYASKVNLSFDAELFWNYYEERNWMIKDSPIRDWKSLLLTWEKNAKRKQPNLDIIENEYSKEHIKKKEEESLKVLDDLLLDDS